MINQLKLFKKPGWFDFGKFRILNQENHIDRQVDIGKLETVISLETVLVVCYLSLEHLIRNQNIRKECQRFRYQAQAHKEELKKLFPLSQESETAIENKANKYLLQLDHPFLFLGAILTLTISLAENKRGVYKYLFRTYKKHADFLNRFVEDNIEEINFLKRENKFYLNRIGDTRLKISLD